jgi:hypothetical protein
MSSVKHLSRIVVALQIVTAIVGIVGAFVHFVSIAAVVIGFLSILVGQRLDEVRMAEIKKRIDDGNVYQLQHLVG